MGSTKGKRVTGLQVSLSASYRSKRLHRASRLGKIVPAAPFQCYLLMRRESCYLVLVSGGGQWSKAVIVLAALYTGP